MLAAEMSSCEHCDRTDMTIMIGMKPGADGKDWSLCRRCFQLGLEPTRVQITTETPFYPVRPSTGKEESWVLHESERVPIEEISTPKTDVANFDRMTEGAAKVRPKKRSSR